MALIKCPVCQKDTPEQADHCPHCGHPLRPGKPSPPKTSVLRHFKWAGIGLVLIFLVWGLATYLNDSTPGCDDFGVKEVTLNMIKEQLLPQVLVQEAIDQIGLRLDNIKTIGKDNSAHTRTCSAQVILSGKNWEDIQTPLTYIAYQSENKDEIIVTAEFDKPESLLEINDWDF